MFKFWSRLACGGFLAWLASGAALGCISPRSDARNLRLREQALAASLPQAQAIAVRSSPALDEIARLEDARSLGDGRLLQLLESSDPELRARAARALGRLPLPGQDVYGDPLLERVGAALCRALLDVEPQVRAEAAFALGLRAEASTQPNLFAALTDPDPQVRARLIEAASRFEDPLLRAAVLSALSDPDLGVRCEAAQGASRWKSTADDALATDLALLRALGTGVDQVPLELARQILASLGRRASERGRGAFLEYAGQADVEARLLALKGLASLALKSPGTDPARVQAATAALGDRDWRVVYEAVQLLGLEGELESAEAVQGLAGCCRHASAHVRAAAVLALAPQPRVRTDKELTALVQEGLHDVSSNVQAAALLAQARLQAPEECLSLLVDATRSSDAVLRAGAARALVELGAARAMPVLEPLLADELFVAGAAVESLGALLPESHARLVGLLAARDNGLRLQALTSLGEAAVAADLPAIAASVHCAGDGADEVAFNAARALGRLGGADALQALDELTRHANPYVRREAQRAWSQAAGKPYVAAERTSIAHEASSAAPLAGEPYPVYERNPRVLLETSHGELVFELFAAEAPVHVHNFLELIQAGAYDGLSFHRVVPDFVVQGGDYRGDGNGARSYLGEALRAEFTPRKYVRGSLGMPRNDDPDSGGGQFFVAQRATPHLDGRYTLFGQLLLGFEALDRLEVGDRILSAQLLPDVPVPLATR